MKKILIFLLVLCQCAVSFAAPCRIGTTFSKIQCDYLGLDWKETYLHTLETGFDLMRLGAYWNEIEKEEGVYDFSVLDWQIEKAREKKIPVILTVGMKAPRWPEYYIPDWVLKKTDLPMGMDVARDPYLRERTLQFIEKVVRRYRGLEIVHYWQVENEPRNHIGDKYWYIGIPFLKEEVELVRGLDKRNRPVVLTAATYPNRIMRFVARIFVWRDSFKEYMKIGDIIGINVYPIIGQKIWKMERYFFTSVKQREVYYKGVIDYIKGGGKEVWITELQAEPWEPGQVVYRAYAVPPTGWSQMTKEYFREFRELGIDTILLWGCEYWYFRKKVFEDDNWPKMVQVLLKQGGQR